MRDRMIDQSKKPKDTMEVKPYQLHIRMDIKGEIVNT
jgi:hypothetical protein